MQDCSECCSGAVSQMTKDCLMAVVHSHVASHLCQCAIFQQLIMWLFDVDWISGEQPQRQWSKNCLTNCPLSIIGGVFKVSTNEVDESTPKRPQVSARLLGLLFRCSFPNDQRLFDGCGSLARSFQSLPACDLSAVYICNCRFDVFFFHGYIHGKGRW